MSKPGSNTELIENFNFAVEQVKTSTPAKPVSNETKLKFYALYKQATVGPCNTSQPWAVQVVERAKWDAWNSLGKMSKTQAMTEYCDLYLSNN